MSKRFRGGVQVALVGVVPLLLVACFADGDRGYGGLPGSGGATGNGWTTITGGHTGSGGGAAGGARDGGTVNDGGPDAAGACRANSDCRSGALCVAPGQVLCGGICTPVTNPCTTDSDCAPDAAVPLICDYDPCACDQAKRCVPGCVSDADCAAGLICNANHYTNHRCGLVICGAGMPACPANFACDDSLQPVCARSTCTTDSQCSGACVDDSCYAAPGQCQFPTP
jgi:hypothetical protein